MVMVVGFVPSLGSSGSNCSVFYCMPRSIRDSKSVGILINLAGIIRAYVRSSWHTPTCRADLQGRK